MTDDTQQWPLENCPPDAEPAQDPPETVNDRLRADYVPAVPVMPKRDPRLDTLPKDYNPPGRHSAWCGCERCHDRLHALKALRDPAPPDPAGIAQPARHSHGCFCPVCFEAQVRLRVDYLRETGND